MSPPIRVVHVITTLVAGGAERQVEQLVRSGRADTEVVCLYKGGLVRDAIEELGVPVTLLGMDGLSKLTATLRLARVLRRLRPDVVNVHLLSAQLWGIPAARLARVPLIVSTEHSLMDDTIEGRPHRPWLRMLYLLLASLADHTVAVSDTTRARLEAWGLATSSITVIDNAVDLSACAYRPDRREPLRRSLGLPAGSPVIGAVGRLEGVKRFDALLDAVTPFLCERDAYLVIVGDGPQREALERRADELGVAGRVLLTGPRPDVAELLSAFDAFVSMSRDETFGIAIVEAVANGLPVIYAECPALDELDDDSLERMRLPAGPDEAVRLRALLDAVLAAPARRLVPESLRDRYDATRIAAAYADLYAALGASSRARRRSGSWRRGRAA